MQILIERGKHKIIFIAPKDLTPVQFEQVSQHMNNILSDVINNTQKDSPVPDVNAVTKSTSNVATTTERPAFRKRLPNNVVDVKDLTVQQAVTENALVRCPKCGQAHAIVVMSGSSVFLMRKDYKMNEFVTIAEVDADGNHLTNMCCKEDTNRLSYFNDLQSISPIRNSDFTVNNDTEIFCPVCSKSNTFADWKDAFDNPLGRFETEHLCDACGGEVVEKLVKGKTYAHCEKCGLEQAVNK